MQFKLTKRQAEILQWIKRGATNKQIANRLGISVSTVKLHMTAILKTYGARNRQQLLLSALKGLGPEDIPDSVDHGRKPFGWVLLRGTRLVGVVLGKQPSSDWLPIYLSKGE
jgi:DNA-binding CsgD family transcriptional regulator